MQVLILCSTEIEKGNWAAPSELRAAVDGDDVAGDPARLVAAAFGRCSHRA
jgi:hypothetical protein